MSGMIDISEISSKTVQNQDISMKSAESSTASSGDFMPTSPIAACSTAHDLSTSLWASEISANSTMLSEDTATPKHYQLAMNKKPKSFVLGELKAPQNSPNFSEDDADDELESESTFDRQVVCEICGVDLFNSAFDESCTESDSDLAVEMSIMQISTSCCTPCKKRQKFELSKSAEAKAVAQK